MHARLRECTFACCALHTVVLLCKGFHISRVKSARYSGHGQGHTWVLECVGDDSRNPVWTKPEQNLSGEGTHEQRHCVVTRTKLGHIEFWFFPTADDEIRCITQTSRHPIDVHYRSSNRTSATVTTSTKDVERGGGYICCISDYLYFSPEACKLRECCVASGFTPSTPGETPPVYTHDFARYMPTPKTLPIVPGIETETPVQSSAAVAAAGSE